jgi:hypothetical protein
MASSLERERATRALGSPQVQATPALEMPGMHHLA